MVVLLLMQTAMTCKLPAVLNELEVTNAMETLWLLGLQGDTNIDIDITPKGTGVT